MSQRIDLLADFPSIITLPVQWGEMDAYGHVNNGTYFRYFESARIAYFLDLGVPGFRGKDGVGPILAETACRFRAPLVYPDTIHAGARVASYYEHGFFQEYAIFSEKLARIVATGSARIVTFDYDSGVKVAMPPDLLRAIEGREGRPVPLSR